MQLKIKQLLILLVLISFSLNFQVYSNPLVISTKFINKWIAKIPKSILTKKLANLSFKELQRYFSKAERIDFLLEKAYIEGRINPAYMYALRLKYSKIPNGDKLLFMCLKDKQCNLLTFSEQANTWLYQYLIQRLPFIPSKYELEKKIIANFVERFTIKFFEKEGWKCLSGKYRGDNGFDGLCVKTNFLGKIQDVLILESKANNSQLIKTSNGKQMSTSWVISILKSLKNQEEANKNWLEKLIFGNKYQDILRLVEQGKYRRRLIRIKSTKQGLDIEMYSVRSKGYSDISVELKNHIKANLIRPRTGQDKYIKSIVKEALEETLEKYR
jgi:hypothetical protein